MVRERAIERERGQEKRIQIFLLHASRRNGGREFYFHLSMLFDCFLFCCNRLQTFSLRKIANKCLLSPFIPFAPFKTNKRNDSVNCFYIYLNEKRKMLLHIFVCGLVKPKFLIFIIRQAHTHTRMNTYLNIHTNVYRNSKRNQPTYRQRNEKRNSVYFEYAQAPDVNSNRKTPCGDTNQPNNCHKQYTHTSKEVKIRKEWNRETRMN